MGMNCSKKEERTGSCQQLYWRVYILQVSILEHSMRNILKPSEFKKENRARTDMHDLREISYREDSQENARINRYWEKGEDNKANRWLNHLHEKPLLELMNEQLQPSEFVPLKPTQLNCYQRLKTLLAVQNAGKGNVERAQSNTKLLKNVVIFESEINKLEQSYQSLQRNKVSGQQSKNTRSYICSKSTTKHNSICDKNSLSYTLNTTLKQFAKRSSQGRYSTKQQHPKHDLIKKTIKEEITDLKKQSFSRFIHHKKEINDRSFVQLQQFFNSALDKKIEEMVDRKILEYDHLKEQNSKFNTILLEKELHIQHLLKQIKLKQQKLLYEIEKQEPHQQMITLKLTVQQFYDQFHHIFGNISLMQLKKKLDSMQSMCLKNYTATEGQHLDLYSKLKSQNLQLQNKLKERQKKYEQREAQLNSIIKQREKYDKLDNSTEKHEIFNRIPQFRQKMEQLDRLQRFILDKYVQWLNSKSEPETKLIRLINTPSPLHNYQEMIEDMLFYKQELTADKQTNYTNKLLAAILKLKKTINPSKMHQKLQPIKCLEQIELYIKNLKSKRTIAKKKTFKSKTDLPIENMEDTPFLE